MKTKARICIHCNDNRVVKNGHSPNGKQNYLCRNCKKQFLEGAENYFVKETDKELIKRTLLERNSLRATARISGRSVPIVMQIKNEFHQQELKKGISIPERGKKSA